MNTEPDQMKMAPAGRKFSNRSILLLAAGACVIAMVIVLRQHPSSPIVRTCVIPRVMGVECEISVVVHPSETKKFNLAMDEIALKLRRAEALMSTYISASQLSRFNDTSADQEAEMSAELMDILCISRELSEQTGGAFDVTCQPILRVWENAKNENRLPTEEELALAIAKSGWKHVDLLETSAIKTVSGAGINLGGIGKGYAADIAIETLKSHGFTSAMVNVGASSIRTFGVKPNGEKWKIGVRNPFKPRGSKEYICVIQDEKLAIIKGEGLSISTSGNYERFFEIAGKRYHHIIDPRTGKSAAAVPGVTVIAPTATIADAWSTALSVLGAKGIQLIPENSQIEAMLITGTPENFMLVKTPGFDKFIAKEKPAR